MRYIGNKTRLLGYIDEFIKEHSITAKTFCDLFAGTASVSDYFKGKYEIIANDFLTSSSYLAKAKINNGRIPEFKKFKKVYSTEPFDYFNNIRTYIYEEHFFITNNFSDKCGRMFFSEENAIIIDSIRISIEDMYNRDIITSNEFDFLLASLIESSTKFSNTTGTFEAYLKNWDNRALKRFKLVPLEMNDIKPLSLKNRVFSEDANSIIRKIEGDLLYIDPPYTITEYASAYHVLETIAKYDYPGVLGKTGRRDTNRKSKYTRKTEALNSFEDLIRQSNFKDIIISYSSQSIIPIDDLISMLKLYSMDGKVNIKKIPYRKYKNIRESQKGSNLFEFLIHIRKDNIINKSPLNYSGAKSDLISQITKYLPSNISNFVDVMGGAFNVGSNIHCKHVVYNEYNPFVFNIIKELIEDKEKNIIKYVERQIDKFSLSKGAKDNYIEFRNYYNNSDQKTLDLFVLSMFCFQNQLRFNKSLKFNTPVGNCGYNDDLKHRIERFSYKANSIEFINKSFNQIDYEKYDKNSLFYFDPPYFITNATYNDGKRGFEGWNSDLESDLLHCITTLNDKGYKFMLSNVIEHKGKINHILKEWVETHKFNCYSLDYKKRKEVIITNYKLQGGER